MERPYSLDDYILEVKEYCHQNGIEKPSVIAHSFGGRIALKLSATEGDFFDKIVITGGAGLKPKRSIKYRLKKLYFNLLKKFVSKKRLKRFYSKDYNSLTPIMQESFKLIVNEHLDGYLKDIQNEVLLIYGERDRETPLYMAKRLNQKIPNSNLSVYKNAGHFCFLDSPNKFNMEVREFLLSR